MIAKLLIAVAAVAGIAAAWYYFKVIAKRPDNYAKLTPAQQSAYDAMLLNASTIDGSQFE